MSIAMTEGAGFEPAVRVNGLRFSRPVHSTTLPPLRTRGEASLTRMFDRLPERDDPEQLPQPLDGEPGLFVVDATWGEIAPISLHPEVRTVGELEVIEHLRAGGRAVDTRQPEYVENGTLAGAIPVVHEEIVERRDEFDDGEGQVLMFCNGPLCTATPQAVERLIDDGFPPARILYYRGGIRDWVTLGLPLSRP